MKEHSAKSWSKVTCQNRVLAETDCDISASENVTDSPTALVRITARMGKSGASTKRARSGTSGESTPESRIAEIAKDSQDDDVQSEPSEDGQDDARRAGEQVLDLLKGVDQKKLIALLQSGALEDVMTSQVQGAKKLAKVVQECVYPLLPRDVRDMYDVACYDSNAGFPDWTSAKWTELLESVDPYSEAKPSLDAYPHNPLVNGRARIAPSEALRRFKLPANASKLWWTQNSSPCRTSKLSLCFVFPCMVWNMLQLICPRSMTITFENSQRVLSLCSNFNLSIFCTCMLMLSVARRQLLSRLSA